MAHMSTDISGALYHGGYDDKKIVKDVLEMGDHFLSTGDLVTIGEDRSFYFQDRLGDTYR